MGFDVLAFAVVFLALSAGLFLPLEWAFPRAPLPLLPARALSTSALFLFNTALMGALGDPLLQWVEAHAHDRSPAFTVARAVAAVVLGDLSGYLFHRAAHRLPVLWRFHRLHHDGTEALGWLDAWRQHPVDFLLHALAVGLPGALLGAGLGELAFVVLARQSFTSLLHANVRLSFGPLEGLLASPAFHHLHHSADPRLHDRNFASTFPVWDLLFGTFRPRATPPAHGHDRPGPLPAADRLHHRERGGGAVQLLRDEEHPHVLHAELPARPARPG